MVSFCNQKGGSTKNGLIATGNVEMDELQDEAQRVDATYSGVPQYVEPVDHRESSNPAEVVQGHRACF